MKKSYKAEVAERITAHLKRFEADKTINAKRADFRNTQPYYCPSCRPSPRGFSIMYVSYQGTLKLTTEEAELYLVWLDEGNVGKHWEALKHANRPKRSGAHQVGTNEAKEAN